MNRHTLITVVFILLCGGLQAQKWCETTVIIPAVYDTITEQVETQAAWTEYVCVPAVFNQTVHTRTIREKAIEHKWIWKNGKKVICEVELPAVTEQYVRSVMVTPPTTQIVHHPAIYDTRTRITQIKESQTKIVMVDCNEVTNLINSQ